MFDRVERCVQVQPDNGLVLVIWELFYRADVLNAGVIDFRAGSGALYNREIVQLVLKNLVSFEER